MYYEETLDCNYGIIAAVGFIRLWWGYDTGRKNRRSTETNRNQHGRRTCAYDDGKHGL